MSRKRHRPSTTIDSAAVAEALRSKTLGDIAFSSSEIELFTASLSSRHENVLRMRRDSILGAVGSPLPWYDLAFRVVSDDEAFPVKKIKSTSERTAQAIVPASLGVKPSRTIDYAAGDFYLQDAGSLLALAACRADSDALQGKRVCDLCAAPGGKASALVEAIGSSGFVLANEPIRTRLPPLAYNLARTGSDRYAISCLDPEKLASRLPGSFDLVVVDAPCSGQALMARGKQSGGAVSPSTIATNAKRQRRILEAAISLLRPGGLLVYSTCTFAVAENEEQIHWLITERGLQADPVDRLSDFQSSLCDATYRVWPHRDQCAGAFAGVVRKPIETTVNSQGDDEDNQNDRRHAASRFSKRSADRLQMQVESTEAKDLLDSLFEVANAPTTYAQRDWLIDGCCDDGPEWLEFEADIIVGGPECLHRAGQTWKPSHAAALRREPHHRPQTTFELNDQQASAFLAGETISMDQRGWVVMIHRGRGLGWGKGDGRIAKNHLPKHARLKVER